MDIAHLPEKRVRVLTEKAMEEFQGKVASYLKRLQESWILVTKELDNAVGDDLDTASIKKHELSICMQYGEYRMISREYHAYLSATRTEECVHHMDKLKERGDRCERMVNSVLTQLDLKRKLLEIDRRSEGSSRSRASSNLSRAKAKAEAMKARLALAEKELELKKRQASLREEQAHTVAKAEREQEEINADLNLLQEKKEYAEATAEAEYYTTIDQWNEDEELSLLRNEPMQDPMDRTREFVDRHSAADLRNPEPSSLRVDATTFTPREHMRHDCSVIHGDTSSADVSAHMQSPAHTSPPTSTEWNLGTEFGRFLIKKDLLMSRFTKFQDDPVVYAVWKGTFKNIIEELGVTPQEEMDLLIKWLGPESSRQALNLRAANTHNPTHGLQRIWQRLDERYGAPELVESTMRRKVSNFPKITNKDHKKLYDLLDLLLEVESLKETPRYSPLLATYDTSVGVSPIVSKLPYHLQNKWMGKAMKYKSEHGAIFPPFIFFVKFLREQAVMLNDPSFNFDSMGPKNENPREDQTLRKVRNISTNKTDVTQPADNPTDVKKCPLHPSSSSHSLDVCKEFIKRPIEERRQILKDNRICFRCCNSDKHQIKNCKAAIHCDECNSPKHVTALHIHKSNEGKPGKRDMPKPTNNVTSAKSSCTETTLDGGEGADITCKCAQICGDATISKSCAKIVKVKLHPKDRPEEKMILYALLDDQSNRSLATPELFDNFKDVCGYERVHYSLSSCGGTIKTMGRRSLGFVVEGIDGERRYELPPLIECSDIPGNKDEIPTPEAALAHAHLRDIAPCIPEFDGSTGIHLLLGRDAVDVHHVLEQRIGPSGSPYGQRLGLGWVIIGEVCLGKVHAPDLVTLNVNKTNIVNGHGSIFQPCRYNLSVREDIRSEALFKREKDDEEIGWSVEDRQFIKLMHEECYRDEEGHWTAPLPFRRPRPQIPNNRRMALRRAKILQESLRRNKIKQEHFITFMNKVFTSGAAEVALPTTDEVWYLPIFGVYNAQKPNQVRGVFDSSAQYQGLSLNDTLLSGPNLTNDLLGILLRFRENEFAAAADIEQMFYSFHVTEADRDFLRFFWYQNNDPNLDLIEYRMKAHVFGNSPSPAVAAYCLKRSVEGDHVDADVKDFVDHNFYVDDGLVSSASEAEAISLLKRTQATLCKEGNLRLHKFISNSSAIMSAFPAEDLGKEVKTLHLDKDDLPTHRSLGLLWDLGTDSFKFDIQPKETPSTRRGILSVLNSIYDPLGFVAPIAIRGKVLMRDITKGYGWDDPLEEGALYRWINFEKSLTTLQELTIPRMIIPLSLSLANMIELHVFCDASEQAVCAVAYLRTHDEDGKELIGFCRGKAKVAPSHGHTIPRLELCAALLGTEIAQTVQRDLSVDLKAICYYTDSKVVLGYICNKKKRFYNYVSNRVQRILNVCNSEQWYYVPTANNPADCGTRGLLTAEEIQQKWIKGPNTMDVEQISGHRVEFPLVNPEEDKEIRVDSRKTEVKINLNGIIERFSVWPRLVSALSVIKCAMRNFTARKAGRNITEVGNLRTETECFIIRQCQMDHYMEEMRSLESGKSVPGSLSIASLNPFLDDSGILHVGGRLNQGCLPYHETNPVILPGKSHVATLIVSHIHQKIKHQGRLFTEGAVRKNGYWVTGAKRLVSSIIHRCITCRKLRRSTHTQIMADLPRDRLTPGPPFTSVGIDTFGPWTVVSRRTRGGMAQSKRWAIMFTCLTTRAVHIEVIEQMSSSSFINALRRLIAIRGNVREIRSDRGTNFIGATDELGINVVNVEDGAVQACLRDSGITWKFNAPHSSHMGGVWERMIGIARNVLDAMLLDAKTKNLTHEVLVTLMAEVGAIVNSRPLCTISSDPEDPVVLTPAMLLNIQYTPPVGLNLDERDMYKKQWKMVQVLSETFWKRWNQGYLQSLQARRKWKTELENIKNGDVILLKEKCLPRNKWPMGVVINSIESKSDNKVRKAEVRVCQNGKCSTYTRPITDMVLLVD